MSDEIKMSGDMEEWARSFAGVAPAAGAGPVKSVAVDTIPLDEIAAPNRRIVPCDERRLGILLNAVLNSTMGSLLTQYGDKWLNPLDVGAYDEALQAEGLVMKWHGSWNKERVFDIRIAKTPMELEAHRKSVPDGWASPWFGDRFGMWAAQKFFSLSDDAYSFLFAPITYEDAGISLTQQTVAARIKLVIVRGGLVPRSWVRGESPDAVVRA